MARLNTKQVLEELRKWRVEPDLERLFRDHAVELFQFLVTEIQTGNLSEVQRSQALWTLHRLTLQTCFDKKQAVLDIALLYLNDTSPRVRESAAYILIRQVQLEKESPWAHLWPKLGRDTIEAPLKHAAELGFRTKGAAMFVADFLRADF